MIKRGTGSPIIHPRIRTFRLPTRSINTPANTFAKTLVSPNPMMKESVMVVEVIPKSCFAMRGTMERSSPHIAPTKAVSTINSSSWAHLTDGLGYSSHISQSLLPPPPCNTLILPNRRGRIRGVHRVLRVRQRREGCVDEDRELGGINAYGVIVR